MSSKACAATLNPIRKVPIRFIISRDTAAETAAPEPKEKRMLLSTVLPKMPYPTPARGKYTRSKPV